MSPIDKTASSQTESLAFELDCYGWRMMGGKLVDLLAKIATVAQNGPPATKARPGASKAKQ